MCLDCVRKQRDAELVSLKECINGTIRYHGNSDAGAYYRQINEVVNRIINLNENEKSFLEEEEETSTNES
jgi:hypothetical protein